MIDVKGGFFINALPAQKERERENNNVLDEASGEIGAINRK